MANKFFKACPVVAGFIFFAKIKLKVVFAVKREIVHKMDLPVYSFEAIVAYTIRDGQKLGL